MKSPPVLWCLAFLTMAALGEAPDKGSKEPPAIPGIPGLESPPQPQEPHVKMWEVQRGLKTGLGGDPAPEDVSDASELVDARPWLEANGIQFASDEESIFDQRLRVLVVKARDDTLQSIDGFGLIKVTSKLKQQPTIQVEATLVEFSDPKPMQLAGEIPVEKLRQEAGDSWRILNPMQVRTKSGERSEAIFKTGSAEQTMVSSTPANPEVRADDAPLQFAEGESGATLFVEPMAGNNGEPFEVAIEYRYRAPGKPGWDWNTKTAAAIRWGKESIVQLDNVPRSGEPSEATRFRALILRGNVERRNDTPLPALKPATIAAVAPVPERALENREAGTPVEARKGVVPPTKIWFLPFRPLPVGAAGDHLPEETNGPDMPVDARDWLISQGVEFAPDEEAICDLRLRAVMLRVRPEKLDLIREIWLAGDPRYSRRNLRFQAELVEFDTSKALDFGASPTVELLRKTAGDSWHVLSRTQLVTHSGYRASAFSRTNPPDAAGAASAGEDQLNGTTPGLLPHEFGTLFDVEPKVAPDGKTIDSILTYHFREAGSPETDWRTETASTIEAGSAEFLQLGSWAPDGDLSQPLKSRGLVLKMDWFDSLQESGEDTEP
jgi:hypothetical protein